MKRTIEANTIARTLRQWNDRTIYLTPHEKPIEHTAAGKASHTRKAAQPQPRTVLMPELTYRHIARILCHVEPESKDYPQAIETTLATIKALPAQHRLSMRIAYIFASKVPYEERGDCFQTFTATLIGRGVSDERLAYAICRCDWLDWWRAYKIRQHVDLDTTITDEDGNATTLGNLIVGMVDFEQRIGSELDAASLWERIPADIRPLIIKRMTGRALITTRTSEPIAQPLIGKNRRAYAGYLKRGRPKTDAALTDCERQRFNRWLHGAGASLLLSD